ncbi:DUF305 domain-containing protein [Gordonia sp. ABSL1-1]|uniref:DUF305 domain-containing protein n=1 Tax=Gordonia sp. ABSL1-1 TaxID=3053923 RepID=UPI00257410B5|nr:DUF305 domain-containing protein [Gordonia sp. ABSL1-1]MDL9935123.1 DUF305 domain-containing protein [Gordonia sp. ABSL1-1]
MTIYQNPAVRRTAAAVVAFGLAVAIAGCSSSDSDDTGAASTAQHTETGTHNHADTQFTMMMIPHHRQAVEMAALVDGHTENADVRRLAAAISNAQQPEIDEMNARLKAWGMPAGGHGDGHGGHGSGMPHMSQMPSMSQMPGMPGMPGMMTAEQMAALRAASGAAFDRLWLTAMIEHHRGAIAMADTEIADGADAATKALAQRIRTAQQREIDEMTALLAR